MSYQLGVDLGTTRLTTAVARPGGAVEPAGSVPAVVHLDPDGTLLVGAAAQRRTLSEPERVVHELVRRIGDRTPLVVGDVPVAAEALAARVVGHAVRTVAGTEGGPPAGIAVTHPATWGPHKLGALHAALDAAGLGRARLLAEPQAAAVRHLTSADLPDGAVLAVLDLGGGTCDAAVLRRAGPGFAPAGRPERIERLGGTAIDDLLFDHVRAELGTRWAELDPSDPATLSAVAALRAACAAAKEELSRARTATVPVALPGSRGEVRTEVRLDRAGFEELVRPAVLEAVELLARVLEPVAPAGGPTVLLVGGSARIPLVAELVAERVGTAVVVDADPGAATAMGAALAAQPARSPAPRPVAAGAGPAGITTAHPDRTEPALPVPPPARPPAVAAAQPATGTRPAVTGGDTARALRPIALPAVPAVGPPPDPVGGVRPFRPAGSQRRRIPVAVAAVAAVLATVVGAGGLLAVYRAGSIEPTGSPAEASTPIVTAPPTPGPTAEVVVVPTPAAEAPQPRPERAAPPAPAAPRPAPAPAAGPPQVTSAPTVAPDSSTVPPDAGAEPPPVEVTPAPEVDPGDDQEEGGGTGDDEQQPSGAGASAEPASADPQDGR